MFQARVRIEPLVETDIKLLVTLAGEIWRTHYPGIVEPAQIEYMLARRYEPRLIRAELGRGDVWWDKLMVGDEIAGFASYFLGGAPGEMKLDKLYVHQRHQRRGYGGRLIERASEVARARGCRKLTLAVNKGNHGAIAAYLKHGFRIADAVVKDIGGGFVMDDYLMEKPVGGGP